MSKYKRIELNVVSFLSSMGGDVYIDRVSIQENDNGQEYIIMEWGHDGKFCLDVWRSDNSCIEVYYLPSGDPEIDKDNIFLFVYTNTYASLRFAETWRIGDDLYDPFINSVKRDW